MDEKTPEQAATVTPGQAAYETFDRAFREQFPVYSDGSGEPWEGTSDGERALWEAAAQAAIDFANVPSLIVDIKGKLSEADYAELRKRLEEDARRRKPGSERVAELVTEGNELREVVAEMLDRFGPPTGEVQYATAGHVQIAKWHERAGLTRAAVVTAGTEHLAEKIRDLAIGAQDAP